MTPEPAQALAAVVGQVVRRAVADAGAAGVALLDDATPEAALAAAWLAAALGDEGVRSIAAPPPEAGAAAADAGLVRAERHRMMLRLAAAAAGMLAAHPVNKTTLLLAGAPPPEPLLPLGDLYASRVAALAGGWSGPPALRRLAERAGGIAALDAALAGLLEERREAEEALAALPPAVAEEVLACLAAGRFHRRRLGLVPKLGGRTPGMDLFT
jgi:hypothetical protein